MQTQSLGCSVVAPSTMTTTQEFTKKESFSKLINRLALEIRDLTQEMVQVNAPFDRAPTRVVQQEQMNLLDKVTQTHPVWLLPSLSDEEAIRILQTQPPGTFVVRRSRKLLKKVLSLRLDYNSEELVRDFPVIETQYTFSLEGSAVSFADLVRMVAFYCISRDILPFTLRLPEVIAVTRTKNDLQVVAQLGAGFWNSAFCDPGALLSVAMTANTSQEDHQTHSALCFLDPVFLHEHHPQGDSTSAASHLSLQHTRTKEMAYWIHPAMEPQVTAPTATPLGLCSSPAGLKKKLSSHMSMESQIVEEMLTRSQTKVHRSSSAEEASNIAAYPGLEVLVNGAGGQQKLGQRLSDMSISTSSSDSAYSYPQQSKLFGDSSVEEEENEDDEEEAVALEEEEEEEEEVYIYIEGNVENNPQPSIKAKKHQGLSPLAVLRAPLRRMSSALEALVAPERRAVRQVQSLVRKKTSFFGCLVQDYVSLVQEDNSCYMSSMDLLQTLRQFLTQTKAYLTQSSELQPPIHSLVPEDCIDHVLETAMHKCVLKPLKDNVLRALQDFQEKSGEWQQLKANLAQAKTRTPKELGADEMVAPDSQAIEKIRQKFHNMCKTYSPEKKVANLLQACKIIYTIMEGNSAGGRGADDFLPMLTYVFAQCDMPQLDLEIQYMMELLDPSQLNGEGGYYLTSAYAAMSLIRNFEEEQAAQTLSLQTRSTLQQWHQRRTTQRSTPVIEDLQMYLRVALQDPNSGCTAKTLLVPPFCTTQEVCQLCADKFQVQDPENHALFLLTEGGAKQLEPSTLPQLIKAEIHSQPQILPFCFVYCHVSNLNLRG